MGVAWHAQGPEVEGGEATLLGCPPALSRRGWGVQSPERMNRTSEQACAGHAMGAHSGHPCKQGPRREHPPLPREPPPGSAFPSHTS